MTIKFFLLLESLESIFKEYIPFILFVGVIIAYVQSRQQQKIKRDAEFITWKELGLLFGATFILQLCLRFFTQIDYTDGFFYIINFVLIPILASLTEKRLTAEEKKKIDTDFSVQGLVFAVALIISTFTAILIFLIFD